MRGRLPFVPGPLRGELRLPGDKSISHRALIAGGALDRAARISSLNCGYDVRSTARVLRALGVRIEQRGEQVQMRGGRLHATDAVLNCENSGSTARMLLGACAGANIHARFDGDASLQKRPMEPVAAQLRAFGARIETAQGCLPVALSGTPKIETRHFILLAPSAQVKSALLFAAVYAGIGITISGDRGSRDHTERLLQYLGADIDWNGRSITLRPFGSLRADPITIGGDFSSAAFLIVAAAISPGSSLVLRDVGVNSTRTGLLDALHAMGAAISIGNRRTLCNEPIADLAVEYVPLRSTVVDADLALRAIDELPLLAFAAAFAQGETRITGMRQLRTKESDRFAAVERLLASCGIQSAVGPDAITIVGGAPVAPTLPIDTGGDHRIAMAAAVLGCAIEGIAVDDLRSAGVSFPEFVPVLTTALAQRP